jgi:hypothetical protein
MARILNQGLCEQHPFACGAELPLLPRHAEATPPFCDRFLVGRMVTARSDALQLGLPGRRPEAFSPNVGDSRQDRVAWPRPPHELGRDRTRAYGQQCNGGGVWLRMGGRCARPGIGVQRFRAWSGGSTATHWLIRRSPRFTRYRCSVLYSPPRLTEAPSRGLGAPHPAPERPSQDPGRSPSAGVVSPMSSAGVSPDRIPSCCRIPVQVLRHRDFDCDGAWTPQTPRQRICRIEEIDSRWLTVSTPTRRAAVTRSRRVRNGQPLPDMVPQSILFRFSKSHINRHSRR